MNKPIQFKIKKKSEPEPIIHLGGPVKVESVMKATSTRPQPISEALPPMGALPLAVPVDDAKRPKK